MGDFRISISMYLLVPRTKTKMRREENTDVGAEKFEKKRVTQTRIQTKLMITIQAVTKKRVMGYKNFHKPTTIKLENQQTFS